MHLAGHLTARLAVVAPDPGPGEPWPLLGPALAAARAGRVREAQAAFERLREEGAPDVLVLAGLVDCALARGAVAEAVTLGERLAAYAERPGAAGALAHHAGAEVSSALGDASRSAEQALLAGTSLAGETARVRASIDELALVPWRATAALALVRTGSRREAADLAQQWHEGAEASGSAYAQAHALRTLATVGAVGNRTELLRRAAGLLEHTDADRLAAQVDTDLAGLLVLDGSAASAAEALVLLRRAEEHAGRHGLWPLHGRVRRLLERLGAPPRPAQSEALAALTAAEGRVAQRAADGWTNRRIAEDLAVSVKAVEGHLSHVYRKLGIRSRGDLAGRFAALA